MEATYVNISELRLGKVVAEDIFANTQYPILFKNTKITHEHLHVFKAFNILKVLVFKDLQDPVAIEDEGIRNNCRYTCTDNNPLNVIMKRQLLI